MLQVKNNGTLMSLPVTAKVELPPMVVTSTRAIRREEILTADALCYSALPRRTGDVARYYTEIEDVVGKQVKRSISSGLPLTDDFVGEPLVVNRNDLVEVESVAGAIVVRSSAKALGSGALGDLIEIEMPSKHRLHATVVGQSLVRVTAVAARPTSTR